MAVNETNLVGRKYRVWDAANNIWKRLSFWTKASDVEMENGTNLESEIGTIKSTLSEKTNNNNLASVETGNTASQSYTVGSHLIWNGIYYVVTQVIAVGGAFNVGVNIQQSTMSSEIESLKVYSSDETEVGTWIDGKKLYKRMLKTSSTYTGSTYSVGMTPEPVIPTDCRIVYYTGTVFMGSGGYTDEVYTLPVREMGTGGSYRKYVNYSFKYRDTHKNKLCQEFYCSQNYSLWGVLEVYYTKS